MATYKLADDVWLVKEVGRVRGVLLTHMEKGVEYTVEEVLDLLSYCGLDYSNPVYMSIGSELIAEGTIELVP